MALDLTTRRVPLDTDPNGVVRVGRTRVTLDTLVATFEDGATPEEIAQQFPSVELADVYAVIAYYLERRTDVRAYLAKREATRELVRSQNEQRFDPVGVRERLLRRQRASDI